MLCLVTLDYPILSTLWVCSLSLWPDFVGQMFLDLSSNFMKHNMIITKKTDKTMNITICNWNTFFNLSMYVQLWQICLKSVNNLSQDKRFQRFHWTSYMKFLLGQVLLPEPSLCATLESRWSQIMELIMLCVIVCDFKQTSRSSSAARWWPV